MANWLVINSYTWDKNTAGENKGMAVHCLKGNYKSPGNNIYKSNNLIQNLPPYEFDKYTQNDLWEIIRAITKSCYKDILHLLPGDWKLIDLTKEWVCDSCTEVHNNTVKKYKNYGRIMCESCLINEYKHQFNQINYVYFIKESSNHFVKIGQSNNVEKRLNTVQTSSPAELSLELKIPTFDSISGEKFFHKLFSDKHVRGEWYRIEENKLEFLKTLNEKLLAKGLSLIDILCASKKIYNKFNSLKEIEEYIEDWIEKNPHAKTPNDFLRIYFAKP